ncbi:MAG: molecular chaperone DnaK, partial [Treponema sp.]|nr:molecular chaperone DnaK [Treponema sp.]
LESGDIQAIKDKTEALKQASYKIAEEIYKQQATAGQQPGGGTGGPESGGAGFNPNMGGAGGGQGSDNTQSAEDADYEVVDDNK